MTPGNFCTLRLTLDAIKPALSMFKQTYSFNHKMSYGGMCLTTGQLQTSICLVSKYTLVSILIGSNA